MFEPRKPLWKKVLLPVVVIVILGVAGYVGWSMYGAQVEPESEGTQTQQQSQQPTAQEQGPDEDIETVTFTAQDPSLELTHPSTWETNEDDGNVYLDSPATTMTLTDGSEQDVYFRIFIRQGARPQESDLLARGVAIRPSETLTYSDPPEGQRPETNLSFFGLDSTDNFAYLFVAGNFSLEEGQSLGGDYGQEESTFIISGGYTSDELDPGMSTHPVAIEGFDETDVYEQAIAIIESLRLL